jgi:hypothetical protein
LAVLALPVIGRVLTGVSAFGERILYVCRGALLVQVTVLGLSCEVIVRCELCDAKREAVTQRVMAGDGMLRFLPSTSCATGTVETVSRGPSNLSYSGSCLKPPIEFPFYDLYFVNKYRI